MIVQKFHHNDLVRPIVPLTNGRIIDTHFVRSMSGTVEVYYQIEWPGLPGVVKWWPQSVLESMRGIEEP